MPSVQLEKRDNVLLLTLCNGEKGNLFTDEVFREHHKVLDEVEATQENTALLVCSDSDKHWCNGFDLDWLNGLEPDYFDWLGGLLDKIMVRYALLPMPTIGCISGHCFAGGAILAAALDFRYMRSDRGWFCFSEVDVKIPFTPATIEVVQLLPNPHAVKDLLLTGKRMGGQEAVQRNIADGAFGPDELFAQSFQLASEMAKKDRQTYATIKHRMRKNLLPWTF